MERSVKYKVAGLRGALEEGTCVLPAAERRTKGCPITGGGSQGVVLLDIREHVQLHVPVPFTCALSKARACVCIRKSGRASASCAMRRSRTRVCRAKRPTILRICVILTGCMSHGRVSDEGAADPPSGRDVRMGLSSAIFLCPIFCGIIPAWSHNPPLVNRERDKQVVRDRRDQKAEVRRPKVGVRSSEHFSLQPSDHIACPAFLASIASLARITRYASRETAQCDTRGEGCDAR